MAQGCAWVCAAMDGVAQTVRAALYVLLFASLDLAALPGREKNPLKFATVLPTRLIDSIMAQGNWNILFQEGPFAEFQRQIAIANHFALRGEVAQATYQFNKAQNALNIAYASLRGKYAWPRNPRDISVKGLSWGESRDIFQDFLLCEFQLFLERGLRAHTIGLFELDEFEEIVKRTELQLGSRIADRESEFERLIPLLRSAIQIRKSQKNTAILAYEFARLSDRETLSARNYWQRRLQTFRILENLHYGNIGRAQSIADYMRDRQKDQIDTIAFALIYLRCAAFNEARELLQSAIYFASKEGQTNFQDYGLAAAILENTYVETGHYADALQWSTRALSHLNGLKSSAEIQRSEMLELKRLIQEQTFRQHTATYLTTKACIAEKPEIPEREIADSEMVLKYELFSRVCASKDLETFVVSRLSDKTLTTTATEKLNLITSDLALFKAIKRKDRKYLLENLSKNLHSHSAYKRDLIFFEWGILRSELPKGELLKLLSGKSDYRKAFNIFIHFRRYHLLANHHIPNLNLLGSTDIAVISRSLAARLFDFAPVPITDVASGQESPLHFSTADGTILFSPLQKKIEFFTDARVPAADTIYFGDLPPDAPLLRRIAPLYAFCESCVTESAGARLLVASSQNQASDFSDIFSATVELKGASCNLSQDTSEDTILLKVIDKMDNLPCDLRTERVIFEGDPVPTWLLSSVAWRKNSAMIVFPSNFAEATKNALLFDFFQRANRRQTTNREAFIAAFERAKRSFPDEKKLNQVFYHEAP